jgi:hypothetical protein
MHGLRPGRTEPVRRRGSYCLLLRPFTRMGLRGSNGLERPVYSREHQGRSKKNMNRASSLTRQLLVISIVLSVLVTQAIAAEKNCPAPKLISSIDLIVNDGGLAVMPVTLNGKRAGLTLRLDAIASILAPSSADEWSLPRRKAPRDIAYGDLKIAEMAEYDELVVGDLKYGKGLFLVAPMPMTTPTVEGVEVIGQLSGSSFRGVDFELDLAHKKFNVFSQDHCPGAGVYWSDQYSSAPLLRGKTGELFFPVELEGKKVYAAIQNGRSVTTIGTDITSQFYGFDKSSPGIEETREADGTTYHYRAMQLTAPGLKVTNARIRLVDPEKKCPLDKTSKIGRYACSGGYPMYLGGDVLKQLRLYFATKEGKLYFTAADTAAESAGTRVQTGR